MIDDRKGNVTMVGFGEGHWNAHREQSDIKVDELKNAIGWLKNGELTGIDKIYI